MKIARKKPRKGIVLITTLAILTFLVMLATMVVTTGHNALRRASSYAEGELAYQAAVAGVAYAQLQVQKSMSWMVYDPRNGFPTSSNRSLSQDNTTNDAPMVVVENNGYVEGTIPGVTGTIGKFRMNFRPPPHAATGPYDPSNSLPPMAYDSCNNLPFDVVASLYYNGSAYRVVPHNTLAVIVEGYVVDSAGRMRASRLVEAAFTRDMASVIDSVAFSGGNMKVELPETGGVWSVGTADSTRDATGLRAMGNVQMYSLDYDDRQFKYGASVLHMTEDVSGTDYRVQKVQTQTYDVSNISGTTPAQESRTAMADRFPRITADQIYSGSFNDTIRQGVYVAWKRGANVEVAYYNAQFDPQTVDVSYQTPDKMTLTNKANPMDSEQYSPDSSVDTSFITTPGSGKAIVNITGPTKVVGPDNTSDATMNVAFLSQDPANAKVVANFAAKGSDVAVLQSGSAGVTIRGDVQGVGTVITGGDLTMEGHSVLTPTKDSGLSLYSKGDITLEPVQGEDSTPRTDVDEATKAVLATVMQKYEGSTTVVTGDSLSKIASKIKALDIPSGAPGAGAQLIKYVKNHLNYSDDAQAFAFIQTALTNNSTTDSSGKIMITYDSTSTQAVSAYDQVFYGMVYACKNFKVDAGPGKTATIQGALVAYGNDPSIYNGSEGTLPGSAPESSEYYGTGQIHMKGKKVNFTYDPSYLGAISRLLSSTYVKVNRAYVVSY